MLTKRIVRRVTQSDYFRERRCDLLALKSRLERSVQFRGDRTRQVLIDGSSDEGLTGNAEVSVSFRLFVGVVLDVVQATWCRPGGQGLSGLTRLMQLPFRSTLVVEKSPPNMCRYRFLMESLRPMKTYVAMIARDP